MPRPLSFTPIQVADRALKQFWTHGYFASSMDDLVTATGISRHGIYTAFGGKKALYLACFARYQETVVTPAFEVVEAPGADMASVATYFETQIANGEAVGLPGPGCFVANSATEVAPTDADVMVEINRHNSRLRHGFAHALRNSAPTLGEDATYRLSMAMVIFTNGLWTLSRSVDDAETLRRAVHDFLDLVSGGKH